MGSTDNKLIVKNTILLYFRTIFIMLISLYTSRVVLHTLGVEDYGVYNAVGGVVSMFSMISGALSTAISRFITFGLGKGDIDKLKKVFSSSINIQFAISLIVLLLCETLGIWFLNCKMNIPDGRMAAANWVLQCSLFSFIIGLISTPYNACIIAHERMQAFAYISIIEAVLKLSIVYLLIVSPIDKLITYSILLVLVSLIIRLLYGIYCSRNFEECKYVKVKDSSVFKEMLAFSGWSFMNNGAYIFNTQGVNILINIFFGVTFNAARGLATQVEGAVMQFVNNFTTAINPQITKSYASEDRKRMFGLICSGAKYSYFLLLAFALPIMLEIDFILSIWLIEVPEYTSLFIRLLFVGAMVTVVGNTGVTACMATGRIKKYTLWISSIGSMVFFLSWLAYKAGASVQSTYYIYIGVYLVILFVRLFIMTELLDFPITLFVKKVLYRIISVTLISIIIPYLCFRTMEMGWPRFFATLVVSFVSVAFSIYVLGLSQGERLKLVAIVKRRLKNIRK